MTRDLVEDLDPSACMPEYATPLARGICVIVRCRVARYVVSIVKTGLKSTAHPAGAGKPSLSKFAGNDYADLKRLQAKSGLCSDSGSVLPRPDGRLSGSGMKTVSASTVSL